MRLIGVVDLLGGRAVHARAGRRAEYAPVRAVAGVAIPDGDAGALARTYRQALGVRELYVADLDAILGRPAQRREVTTVAAVGAPLWLDAAVTDVGSARAALAAGAARVVVGLETLPSFGALGAICRAVGGERVAFSLDLRGGVPLAAGEVAARGEAPATLAARAADAGAGAVIVLDLARVGTGVGPDVALLEALRASVPHALVLAGGGVRGSADLVQLAEAGCDGALVASALLDGRMGATEVAAAEALPIGREHAGRAAYRSRSR